MTQKSNNVNLDLEKIVFLCNAEEGNPGIYELTWELSYYEISIEEKYKIARKILSELLTENLVTIHKSKDWLNDDHSDEIPLKSALIELNNPTNWYPCNEVLRIILTKKGGDFLKSELPKYADRLGNRLMHKK
jgi:hypothetical protein